jgi:hypothetical protein
MYTLQRFHTTGWMETNKNQRKRDSQKKKKKRHSQLQYAKPFAIRHPVARHRSLISISNRRDKFGANRSVFDNFGAQSQHLDRNLVPKHCNLISIDRFPCPIAAENHRPIDIFSNDPPSAAVNNRRNHTHYHLFTFDTIF